MISNNGANKHPSNSSVSTVAPLHRCWSRRSPSGRRTLGAYSGKISMRTICDTCGIRRSCQQNAFAYGREDSNDRQKLYHNAHNRMVSRPCDFSGDPGVTKAWRTFYHRHRSCVLVCVSTRASPTLACSRTLFHSECISLPIGNRCCGAFVCAATGLKMLRTVSLKTEHSWCEYDERK